LHTAPHFFNHIIMSKLIERKAFSIIMINPIDWETSEEGEALFNEHWAQAIESMRCTAREHGYYAMYDLKTTKHRDEAQKMEYTHLMVYSVGLVPVAGTEEEDTPPTAPEASFTATETAASLEQQVARLSLAASPPASRGGLATA
jgi:hypothetical protein